MHSRAWRASAAAAACAWLIGCATVPRGEAAKDVNEIVSERGLPQAQWPSDETAPTSEQQLGDLLSEPLTVEHSVQLAFVRSPQIRAAYADLGLAEADVIEASRLANPTFSYVDLDPREGEGRSQITRSVAIDFANLLMIPARRRIAGAEYESARQRVAAELLDLATNVESAWYEYVGSQQVAAMRESAARAAEASAEFARRSKEAGNLSARELALELAAASEARIASARAAADMLKARTEFAAQVGISARDPWQTPKRLPVPLATTLSQADLVERALRERFDVVATRREVSTLEEALGLTRRWRYVGEIEVGYEDESETDGGRLRGPSLSIQLPLFNQGQATILRARSRLESAEARLATLEMSVRNEVALGLDRLEASREISERYRTALIPQREAVVGRTQEEQNYMLVGVFELLQAKREELDAYQEYLEAVRDFWLARVELRRAVGGPLPGDEVPTELTIDAEPPRLDGGAS